MTQQSPTPLVSAEWVEKRTDEFISEDPEYRLIEVSIQEHDSHIPGALEVDWQADLRDAETFDILSPEDFAALLESLGCTTESTIVFYGDFYNWFAAQAYWLFRYYGHRDLRLLDGGRRYWDTEGFQQRTASSSVSQGTYPVPTPDESMRVGRDEVREAMEQGACLVDVRAPAEYRGEIIAPPGWNEGVQRGGHIPGATNIPCQRTIQPDHRFRPREQLTSFYRDLVPDDEEIILYCRVGERAALTWFVLHELLDYEKVRYYYGSWVEWGNTVGLPVENLSNADLR